MNVAVHPRHQRRGHARALLTALFDEHRWASQQPYAPLDLQPFTPSSRPPRFLAAMQRGPSPAVPRPSSVRGLCVVLQARCGKRAAGSARFQ
jgi:GNAT superfamily N-acetyltransferase